MDSGQAPTTPSKPTRLQLLQLLETSELRQRQSVKERFHSSNSASRFRIQLWATAVPFAISMACALGKRYFSDPWIPTLGFFLLLISYLVIVLSPLVEIWARRRPLKRYLAAPSAVMVDNAEVALDVDVEIIPQLMRADLADLELASLQLRSERDALERRVGLIIGSIEKVGLFPGILAMATTFGNIHVTDPAKQTPDWVQALAMASVGLYLMGGVAHLTSVRIERYARLLDWASKRKAESVAD